MAFVIDSLEWDFNGQDSGTVSRKLEQILARIDVANNRNEIIYVGNDLQSKPVCGQMDLWAFLYDESMEEIDGLILTELAAFLNAAHYYEDEPSVWPANFLEAQVTFPNDVDVGLDIAFAHFHIISRTPFACLTLNNKTTLKTHSRLDDVAVPRIVEVPLISDELSHKMFWRKTALDLLRDTPENLEKLSSHMYPNLYFIEGVWREIDDFEGGYARVCAQLQKLLEGLDDFGAWVYLEPPPATHPSDTAPRQIGIKPTNELIENRFASIGLEMAPEKPDVRRDSACYNARLVNFKPTPTEEKTLELYCEWHGKLEKHINRVHIHPPLDSSDGKVIIAIFDKHLPLPR